MDHAFIARCVFFKLNDGILYSLYSPQDYVCQAPLAIIRAKTSDPLRIVNVICIEVIFIHNGVCGRSGGVLV